MHTSGSPLSSAHSDEPTTTAADVLRTTSCILTPLPVHNHLSDPYIHLGCSPAAYSNSSCAPLYSSIPPHLDQIDSLSFLPTTLRINSSFINPFETSFDIPTSHCSASFIKGPIVPSVAFPSGFQLLPSSLSSSLPSTDRPSSLVSLNTPFSLSGSAYTMLQSGLTRCLSTQSHVGSADIVSPGILQSVTPPILAAMPHTLLSSSSTKILCPSSSGLHSDSFTQSAEQTVSPSQALNENSDFASLSGLNLGLKVPSGRNETGGMLLISVSLVFVK
ncbi:unnamed protein product [Protopolystoma xenopodis]|uniref:Uncharacterized protein n=1 Tax=Protopolystoma xenopodis TaxID=117903 RepID=A0A448XQL2_9PLAT|nr:unnamed protein product [Protopolystoma xenopodis]